MGFNEEDLSKSKLIRKILEMIQTLSDPNAPLEKKMLIFTSLFAATYSLYNLTKILNTETKTENYENNKVMEK